VPRADDGTSIDRYRALERLRSISWLSDVGLPDAVALLGMPPIDLGPEMARGFGRYPAVVTGPSRPRLASDVDDVGEEVACIRLPDGSVPLDISFGWNPGTRRPDTPVEAWNLVGARVALPPQELLGRYGSFEMFLARVRV
jgi:hypothetical protein